MRALLIAVICAFLLSVACVQDNGPSAPIPVAKDAIVPTVTANQALQVGARRSWAATLEEQLLGIGIDAEVRTLGEKRETVQIRYALMSRPLAYRLYHQALIGVRAEQLGFKKVVFTDDEGAQWYWYVNAAAEAEAKSAEAKQRTVRAAAEADEPRQRELLRRRQCAQLIESNTPHESWPVYCLHSQ